MDCVCLNKKSKAFFSEKLSAYLCMFIIVVFTYVLQPALSFAEGPYAFAFSSTLDDRLYLHKKVAPEIPVVLLASNSDGTCRATTGKQVEKTTGYGFSFPLTELAVEKHCDILNSRFISVIGVETVPFRRLEMANATDIDPKTRHKLDDYVKTNCKYHDGQSKYRNPVLLKYTTTNIKQSTYEIFLYRYTPYDGMTGKALFIACEQAISDFDIECGYESPFFFTIGEVLYFRYVYGKCESGRWGWYLYEATGASVPRKIVENYDYSD